MDEFYDATPRAEHFSCSTSGYRPIPCHQLHLHAQPKRGLGVLQRTSAGEHQEGHRAVEELGLTQHSGSEDEDWRSDDREGNSVLGYVAVCMSEADLLISAPRSKDKGQGPPMGIHNGQREASSQATNYQPFEAFIWRRILFHHLLFICLSVAIYASANSTAKPPAHSPR